jgi:hypothetical protein
MERLGVIGSREFAAREWLFSLLDERRAAHGDFLVIAGEGAGGVPQLAVEWSRERALGHEVVNPAKVIAMCDRVLAVTYGVDGETEGLMSRARASGKGIIEVIFTPAQAEEPAPAAVSVSAPAPSPPPKKAGKKAEAPPEPAAPEVVEEEDDDL